MELAANDRVAAVLLWWEARRQVRVEGRAERLSPGESDAYFASRNRGSQLSARASPQSQVVDSREELEQRVQDQETLFAGAEVPRPEWWGGYLIVPSVVEFWKGAEHRLHDRFRYTREEAGWVIERLAP